MLEKTAASLEPCGFQRVVPGATQSLRTTRRLRTGFWKHGAADIELTTAWQALMHGTFDLNMGSASEENRGSVLNASSFLLDFLYPTGAVAFMRRLTPTTSISTSCPNKLHNGRRFAIAAPRLYTPSLPRRQVDPSGTEPTTNQGAHKPRNGASTSEGDAAYMEGTKVKEEGGTLTPPLGDIEVNAESMEPGITVDDANYIDSDDDHVEALGNLLERDDPEKADLVWHHYEALDEQSRTTYMSYVLVFLSKCGRLSDSWKISELFHKLPLSQWTNQIFVAGVTAEINLQNDNQALEFFIKGLDHSALNLPPLIDALDLLLASALRAPAPELLRNLWQHYPKMATRWDLDGIMSQFKGIASVPSLVVLKDIRKYYPQMIARWNFDGITSQLKRVALVPGLAEKALEFQVRDRQGLQSTGLSQEALDSLQRILVRRALESCADAQVIPLLNITKDPLAFEEFLREATNRDKRKLGTEVYEIYRDLPGSVPSHPVLHDVFKAYNGLNAPMSIKYAGLELLWGDWYRFHTTPSYRAFQRYLAFLASRGETKRVYELWTHFIELYRDGPIRNILEADDTFAHLLQVHAVQGEAEEAQRIFDDVSGRFGIEPNQYYWSILLNAYVKANDYDGAISTFEKIVQAGKANEYSYGTIMQMAGDRGDLGFTIDLYRQGLSVGVRANEAVLSSLVDAYCQNGYFTAAEHVCVRAAKGGNIKPRIWNKLINYHALRRDLAALNRVLNLMVKSNIPYDQFTHQQLLLGLSLCRQSQHAVNLLAVALKDKIFEVTPEHFNIVISALLITGEPDSVLRVHKLMLNHGFPSSSESLFRLTQALGQWKKLPPHQRTQLKGTEWLGKALRSFNEIYGLPSSTDNLNQLSSPSVKRSQVGELLGRRIEKTHFSSMVYMFTQLRDFASARELVDIYRYVFQGQQDSDGILPLGMLNSVMVADFEEGHHDRVRETWDLLFEIAKAEARSADYVEGQPRTAKISAKYRHILSGGLAVMQKLLFTKKDAAGIQSLVSTVRSEGFEIDSRNWNFYVDALVQLKQYKGAFVTCEKLLMPNWAGWFVLRSKDNVRNMLPIDLRRRGTSPRYLRPTTTTLYRLAKGYMELDRLGPWSAEAASTLEEIEKECVQVVRAVKSMVRVHSNLEYEILGEDEVDMETVDFEYDGQDYEGDTSRAEEPMN
ncbi:hypothetical protein F4677DRAFT_416858 [Hypoxylon crocopeplum]|nr:hypothetical protein F4677DRAFT_416858 [Hypoxylon crocopeplum]